MTLRRLARLTRMNLLRDRRSAASAGLGVGFGVGALVFFTALGAGATRAVSRVFPVDAAAVEIVAPRVALGSPLGGGRLDADAIARLRALPGVVRAFPKMELRVPAMGSPSEALVAQFRVPAHIYVAVIAIGVDPAYVAADLVAGVVFADPGAGPGSDRPAAGPVPGVAARRLLALYNTSFAPAQRLRPIGEGLVRTAGGIELMTVTAGRSMKGPTGMPERRFGLSFGGFSDRAPLHGVLVPIDFVRRVNATYGEDAASYSAAALVLDDPARVPAVTQAARRMGFGVDDGERQLAQNVGMAVLVTTVAFGLFAALICVLAAVNIAHATSASVRGRARELGLLRAVGATRGDVTLMVLAESAAIGAAGGIAGGLAARLLAVAVDAGAARWLPDFPFKPETFFHFPAGVAALALAAGVLAALGGAWGPARRAARLDPARAMT